MNISYYGHAAREMAVHAGKYILQRRQGSFIVEEKNSSYDFVTDVDKSCEQQIRARIAQLFPHHDFAGEEQNQDEQQLKHRLTNMGPDDFCWVVDPLDGTVNYIRGLSDYGVSIALLKQNQVLLGAIYLPGRDELFYAEKNRGMFLNGKRAGVSQCSVVSDALVATSIPVADMNLRSEVNQYLPKLASSTLNLRMLGSACAAIAYVACGRLDAYVENGHFPWDVAAGMLMVEEAGGQITNHQGERYRLSDSNLVASNGCIQREIVETIQR